MMARSSIGFLSLRQGSAVSDDAFAAGLGFERSEIGYAVGSLLAARAGHCPRPFGGRVPRTPSLSRLQMAGSPAGVPPAGVVQAMLEACLRHDPRSRSEVTIDVLIVIPS